MQVGDADRDHLDVGDVGIGGDEIVAEIVVQHAAVARIDDAFLQQRLADAHDDAALPLAFGQLRIVEPARIQRRDHARRRAPCRNPRRRAPRRNARTSCAANNRPSVGESIAGDGRVVLVAVFGAARSSGKVSRSASIRSRPMRRMSSAMETSGAVAARRGDAAIGDDERVRLQRRGRASSGSLMARPISSSRAASAALCTAPVIRLASCDPPATRRARQRGIAELHHDLLDAARRSPRPRSAPGSYRCPVPCRCCCWRPRPCRPRGCAPALRPACGGPDRCRRQRPSRSAALPSRIERGAGLRFDQPKASAPAAKASRSCRVDQGFLALRILLGIVQQADLQRIDADLIGQLVDRAFDAEGARVLARRAQGAGHHRVHRHDVLARARNWASHT